VFILKGLGSLCRSTKFERCPDQKEARIYTEGAEAAEWTETLMLVSETVVMQIEVCYSADRYRAVSGNYGTAPEAI
jgi:hypothetical protein